MANPHMFRRMIRHTALRAAIVVGLLCVFALGRVAYAAHQCYRLTAGGCGGVELSVDAAHQASQHTACAQQMEAPDDRDPTTPLSQAAFAIAPTLALAFVPAPAYRTPPQDAGPPPILPAPLKVFGRLRL